MLRARPSPLCALASVKCSSYWLFDEPKKCAESGASQRPGSCPTCNTIVQGPVKFLTPIQVKEENELTRTRLRTPAHQRRFQSSLEEHREQEADDAVRELEEERSRAQD